MPELAAVRGERVDLFPLPLDGGHKLFDGGRIGAPPNGRTDDDALVGICIDGQRRKLRHVAALDLLLAQAEQDVVIIGIGLDGADLQKIGTQRPRDALCDRARISAQRIVYDKFFHDTLPPHLRQKVTFSLRYIISIS